MTVARAVTISTETEDHEYDMLEILVVCFDQFD